MSKQGAMQFFLLVAKMREAQKDYFRTRNQGALIRSRELERHVDGWIERGMKHIDDNTPKQGYLFGGYQIADTACKRCPKAHNTLNGRYCDALKRIVEHDKEAPCGGKEDT